DSFSFWSFNQHTISLTYINIVYFHFLLITKNIILRNKYHHNNANKYKQITYTLQSKHPSQCILIYVYVTSFLNNKKAVWNYLIPYSYNSVFLCFFHRNFIVYKIY